MYVALKSLLGNILFIAASLVALPIMTAASQGQQVLSGHVPRAVADSHMLHPLTEGTRLQLAIGLPLRNQKGLDALLEQLSDPASPLYGHYLSPAEFAEQFGPSEEDYQSLIQFARANGLTVTGTHSNRLLLDVAGDSAAIERSMHVKMMVYDHPVRGQFFAPDREPSLDLPVIVQDISGLDNYVLPRPMGLATVALEKATPYVTGSGPGGYFIGKDFRAAYAPGVQLAGSNQTVGLLEFDGFYATDEQKNFAQAGLTPVPTQTVLLDGFNGAPGKANIEVILDIMMASYMAPSLAKVIVYEGTNPNDVLNRMATDNLAAQLSSSWGFGINATTENIYKEYIAQGQSLLQASGDSGAYKSTVMTPADDPNVTVVGGTSLTTAGAGGPWQSEAAWSGSGGGVSTVYSIPSYQQGLSMGSNGGSITMRNLPDVALTADVQIYLIQSNGQAVVVGGTSAAAPLWAGFIALANQQATTSGKQRLGFLNPLIYAIGKGSTYSADLNDIRNGSNNGFSAVSGYDLVTGWGSPAGQPLINDLTGSTTQPGFTLSTSSSSLSTAKGTTGSVTVTISAVTNLGGNVNLSVTGMPSGVTAAFNPASTKTTSTVTFTVSATAATGTYPLTIMGTAGMASRTASLALTVTAPNFALSLTPASLALPHGISGTATVVVIPQGGFNNSVKFNATGMPSGVTVTFGAYSATGTPVTLNVPTTATPGLFSVTVTGVAGALSNSAVLALTILAPPIGTSLVNLAPAYNVNALVADGSAFSGGGLDGGVNGQSTAYSANLVGVQQTVGGALFYFGPANAPDAVSGKTIALTPGQYSEINLLATGVNGSQPKQLFKVTYSDGSTAIFTQSVSDWFTPQFYTGESTALTMAYRDTGQGARDNRTFYLYQYQFALNPSKTVASITLPGNRNVVVLAVTLTGPKVAFHRALGLSR